MRDERYLRRIEREALEQLVQRIDNAARDALCSAMRRRHFDLTEQLKRAGIDSDGIREGTADIDTDADAVADPHTRGFMLPGRTSLRRALVVLAPRAHRSKLRAQLLLLIRSEDRHDVPALLLAIFLLNRVNLRGLIGG